MKRAPRQDPTRIVLATHGELPHHLKLFQPDLAPQTCVIVGEACPDERSQHLQDLGVNVMVAAVDLSGRIDILSALQLLAQQGYMHILLEGGASILGSAFDQHCIDQIVALIAPKVVGGATAPSPAGGNGLSSMSQAWSLQDMQTCMLGQDMLVKGTIHYCHSITNA
jgi:diaminohydroxyphosphoribosylaminopyrimidine deaminase/5-amino-6-(5-phosphoribosylamino)uracil reductase